MPPLSLRGQRFGALAATLLLVLIWPVHVGCDLVSRDEVARVPSPDGGLEAIVIEINGGATTSFVYEVRVVATGESGGTRVAWLDAAVRSDQAYGINVRWPSAAVLCLEYFEAQTATLDAQRLRVGDREVEIRLLDGVLDPTAPPGGMRYNLRGRPYG
jgi:hypothetical protein